MVKRLETTSQDKQIVFVSQFWQLISDSLQGKWPNLLGLGFLICKI